MRRPFLTCVVLCLSCGGGSANGDGESTSSSADTGAMSTTAMTTSTSTSASTSSSTGVEDGTSTLDESGSGSTEGTTGDPGAPACEPAALAELTVVELDPLLFANGDDPSSDPSCTEVRNPGRGFYRTMDLRNADAGGLADVFAEGRRLVYGRVLIPDYVDQPLDDALLGELDDGFSLIRDAGLQVIPRVYYPDNQVDPDAALEMVLQHIDQLAGTWQAHADVTAVVQAGFVGAWGEWHSSPSGLDEPAARAQILEALLAAVPADRMVEVRRPSFKQDVVGGPLDSAGAHDGSALARVAHHNDCFLASDDDFGTYGDTDERLYMEADAPYTMNGGETCAVNPPRSECASAIDELALLHFTTLNEDYNPDVLQSWQDDGCFAQIECRLGYRLLVTHVRAPEQAAAGDTIAVELTVLNDGWASLHNPRPMTVVLRGADEIRRDVEVDPRTFMPGEPATVCVAIDLPPGTAAGAYEIAVHLPDASASLAERSEYAVRIANATWDADAGLNVLPVAITVQ